jgi:hypothetical protein
MVEFLILILINSILPSLYLLSFLKKYFDYEISGISIIGSLILGQLINGLILYYSFLLIPGYKSDFYTIILLVFSMLMFILFYKDIKIIIIFLVNRIKLKLINYRTLEMKNFILNNKIFILFLIYIIFSFFLFLMRGLTNHDSLIYALLGNSLAQFTKIEYSHYLFYENYGLPKISEHGYGFPLFKTLEVLFNLNNGNSDNYFRFIPIINGAYLLGLVYLFLKKFSLNIAIYSTILLFVSGAFIFLISIYGSDSISYSVFILSLVYLYDLTEELNSVNLILFSLAVGLGATIHSINFVILPIQLFLFLILNKDKFIKKISLVFFVIILTFFLGCIHYYLEILLGNGWIFGKSYNLINKILKSAINILKII